jgi:hypothetical protein
MTGLSTLIFLLIGVFTLGTNAFIDFPWQGFVEAGNYGLFGLWIINVFCSQFRSFLDSTRIHY